MYCMVKIRLKRQGRKNRPFYSIVVVDSRVQRDGKVLEKIGWYDPISKKTRLNFFRVLHYLSQGAKPTKTVYGIFERAASRKKIFNSFNNH